MKRLSFRNRIIIGFFILVLVSVANVIYTTRNISLFRNHTELLYNHPLKVSNAVRDINSNIHIIHKTMKDITMLENLDEIKNKLDIVSYHHTGTIENFNLIYSQYLGKKSEIDQAYQSFLNWKPIREEVIRRMHDGDFKGAARITTTKGAEHVNLIISHMQRLADFAENKANLLYHEALLKEQKLLTNIYLTITVLIVLSLLLAGILSYAISKPIQGFINDMKLLFRDNALDTKLEGNESEAIMLEITKNSIATLINTLNEQSEQLKNFNKELEIRVSDRTSELEDIKQDLLAKNNEYESLVEELRQSNEELAYTMEKARESDELKSAFLANMSHEVRTPLNAILGFTSILKKDRSLAEEQTSYLNIIQKSGNQLLNIVNDILDTSMIETGQLKIYEEQTDIRELLNEVITPYKRNNQNAELEFRLNCDPSVPKELLLDSSKIKQIFGNLINNAIRYTHKGFIEIGYSHNETKILFFVKDTGIGIPEKYHEHIFDRFYQIEESIKANHHGTGLGLSICHGFVTQMNGRIWIESNAGSSTQFYFEIPYKKMDSPPKPQKKRTSSPPILKDKISLLIAEDEDFNYLYIKELLKDYNIDLQRATNGKEAVEFVRKAPETDLVLMDIKMPVMDGFKACKTIKEEFPLIPVIAQTAYAMEREITEIEKHFDAYIDKPILPNRFIDLIFEQLGK